jgi:hypothetical protein
MTSLTAAKLEHAAAVLGLPTTQGRRILSDLIPGESQSEINPESLIPIEPLAKRLSCPMAVLIDVLEGRDSFLDAEFVAAMLQRTTEAIRIRMAKRLEYVPAVNMPHIRLYRWSKSQVRRLAANQAAVKAETAPGIVKVPRDVLVTGAKSDVRKLPAGTRAKGCNTDGGGK